MSFSSDDGGTVSFQELQIAPVSHWKTPHKVRRCALHDAVDGGKTEEQKAEATLTEPA
jgi:hypothetical protein